LRTGRRYQFYQFVEPVSFLFLHTYILIISIPLQMVEEELKPISSKGWAGTSAEYLS
jgi:hypothetical protein